MGDNLNIIESIDGYTNASELIQNEDNDYIISYKNNYNNNPKISAKILTHYNCWKLIAKSNKNYGVIFEDDVLFHPNFKEIYNKNEVYINNISKKEEVLIFLGLNDFLPLAYRLSK